MEREREKKIVLCTKRAEGGAIGAASLTAASFFVTRVLKFVEETPRRAVDTFDSMRSFHRRDLIVDLNPLDRPTAVMLFFSFFFFWNSASWA